MVYSGSKLCKRTQLWLHPLPSLLHPTLLFCVDKLGPNIVHMQDPKPFIFWCDPVNGKPWWEMSGEGIEIWLYILLDSSVWKHARRSECSDLSPRVVLAVWLLLGSSVIPSSVPKSTHISAKIYFNEPSTVSLVGVCQLSCMHPMSDTPVPCWDTGDDRKHWNPCVLSCCCFWTIRFNRRILPFLIPSPVFIHYLPNYDMVQNNFN